jgi:predicted dehydrogenase
MAITWAIQTNFLQMRPIIVIGAGGIVHDAHLPAYKIAGYEVTGIYDTDKEKAAATAKKFGVPVVYETLQDVISLAPANVVFDLAVPGKAMIDVLQQLPAGSAVLLQKPMGHNYTEAKRILQITRDKKMIAAVNFQLRYAPYIQEARKIIKQENFGTLHDIEINVNVFTPWHLWKFLYELPRVEILYHSIHYIDLVRSFLGNPQTIYAKTTKHPDQQDLASVRSNIIMDYGNTVRANILTNHNHRFGHEHQSSYIKLEGTKGAIKIRMGLLMNYPEGLPDKMDYVFSKDNKWKSMQPYGSWFPHAFIGSMEQVMLTAEGKIERPDNSVEDCINTMACVEAAYISSEKGGERPQDII